MKWTILKLGLAMLVCCGGANALTDGPMMPEPMSFSAVDVSDVVDLATGDFRYTIPVLSVPSPNGVEYPVTLHYGAGIATNEEASWVGLGWNLNLGAITREVTGMPDDYCARRIYNRSSTESAHAVTAGGGPGPSFTRSYSSLSGKSMFGVGFSMNGKPIDEGYKVGSSTSEVFLDMASTGSGIRSNWEDADIRDIVRPSAGPAKVVWSRSLQIGIDLMGPSFHYSGVWFKFNSNYDIDYYGTLYADHCPRYLLDDDYMKAAGVRQLAESSDLDEGPLYINGAAHAPWMPLDKFNCLAQGLEGGLSPHKKGRMQLRSQESILGDVISEVGFGLSPDYVNNHLSTEPAQEYVFRFDGDPAGYHEQDGYYDAGLSGDLNYHTSRRIQPIYDTDPGSQTYRLITGFVVTKEDGMVYEFKHPVYNYSQYSETSHVPDGLQQGHYVASGTHPTGALDNTPDYAYTWLLTAVKGPDYIDVSGDGLSDDDYGYWVELRYKEVTRDYDYRIPWTGKAVPAQYALKVYDIDKDPVPMKYSFIHGRKGICYLQNIITQSHVAVFSTSPRQDAYERNLGAGGGCGEDSYHRLDHIKLYRKAAFSADANGNGLWEDDEADLACIRGVDFGYTYTLCRGVPNSLATSRGKLTLRSVTQLGAGGVRLPPHTFAYHGDGEWNYRSEAWDRWGLYKPDATYAEHLAVDKDAVQMWSLKEIAFPTGGSLAIEYESDAYNYVYDTPVAGPVSVHGDDQDTYVGGYFVSKKGQNPTFPSGPGTIEIRHAGFGWPANNPGDDDEGDVKRIGDRMVRKLEKWKRINFKEVLIHADELPEGFHVSEIRAYAFVDDNGGYNARIPRGRIPMEGQLASGEWMTIEGRAGFVNVPGPMWLSNTTSSGALSGRTFIRYRIWVQGRYEHNSGSDEMGHRDLRVFFVDQVNPKESMVKLGGGLRVKKLTSHTGLGQKTAQTYYYDTNGDGTGENTGVATSEPPCYASRTNNDRQVEVDYGGGAFLPPPRVIYQQVTVCCPGGGALRHRFLTPQNETQPCKYGCTVPVVWVDWTMERQPDANGLEPAGRMLCEYMRRITNRSALYGKPYEIAKMSSEGRVVAETKYDYGTSTAMEGEHPNLGATYRECMALAVGTAQGKVRNNVATMSEVVENPVLSRMVSTRHGVDSVVTYKQLNARTGTPQVTEVAFYRDTPTGRVLETILSNRVTFAHEKYPGMLTLNMLTQECQNTTHSGAGAATSDATKAVASTVTTWTPFNETRHYKAGSYRWRSRMDDKGDAVANLPAFRFSAPASASASDWQRVTSITSFDQYGRAVEEIDSAGTHHCGMRREGLAVFVARNAALKECVYTSFEEYPTGPITQRIGQGTAAQCDGFAHKAGTRCLTLGKGSASDPHYATSWTSGANTATGELPIRWEFWAKANAPTTSFTHIQTKSDPNAWATRYRREFEVGTEWKKYSFTGAIPASLADKQYRVVLRPPYKDGAFIGGTISYDDVRAYPNDALATSYTYDYGLRQVTFVNDENNNARYFEYDAHGRLRYVRDGSCRLLQKYEYKVGMSGVEDAVELVWASGTKWVWGYYPLQWSGYEGVAHKARVELSRDGGATWTVVEDAMPNEEFYIWHPTNYVAPFDQSNNVAASSNCRLRVTLFNHSGFPLNGGSAMTDIFRLSKAHGFMRRAGQ
jgi:hypothetical protein